MLKLIFSEYDAYRVFQVYHMTAILLDFLIEKVKVRNRATRPCSYSQDELLGNPGNTKTCATKPICSSDSKGAPNTNIYFYFNIADFHCKGTYIGVKKNILLY